MIVLLVNNVILANNVPLGGHAYIEDNVIIGGNSAVQQFTRVGRSAMIGGMCGVVSRYNTLWNRYMAIEVNYKELNLIGLEKKKYSK